MVLNTYVNFCAVRKTGAYLGAYQTGIIYFHEKQLHDKNCKQTFAKCYWKQNYFKKDIC